MPETIKQNLTLCVEVDSESSCGPLLKILNFGYNYRMPCQVKACFVISFVTFPTWLYFDKDF